MELSVTEDRKATQCSNPEIAGDEGLPTLNDDRARSLGYQNHSDRLLHSSLAVDHTEDTRMEMYTTGEPSSPTSTGMKNGMLLEEHGK